MANWESYLNQEAEKPLGKTDSGKCYFPEIGGKVTVVLNEKTTVTIQVHKGLKIFAVGIASDGEKVPIDEVIDQAFMARHIFRVCKGSTPEEKALRLRSRAGTVRFLQEVDKFIKNNPEGGFVELPCFGWRFLKWDKPPQKQEEPEIDLGFY